MFELKTLNDLRSVCSKGDLCTQYDEDIGGAMQVVGYDDCKYDARQAAIEWIKELEKNPENYKDYFSEYSEGHIRPDAWLVINFIKHFFNIKEEELK